MPKISETTAQQSKTDFAKEPAHVSNFRYSLRVLLGRKAVVFGLVIIILLVIMAVFAPLLAPYSPYQTDVKHRLEGPSAQHWLGTDSVGRDTLSRIIYGSRTSLLVSIVALFLASSVGMCLGLIAGYTGGIVHAVIMRVMDALMAVPMMLLALTIAATMGGGLTNVVIALGVSLIPAYARLMCGQAMTIKEGEYVAAARALGASNFRIAFRHVAPNCFPPLIVLMTMQLGTTVLAEAGLSFLGIGIKAPQPSWGNLVTDGYKHLTEVPMLSLAPGLAIMLMVIAFNLVGDGLRDALDPRLKGVI